MFDQLILNDLAMINNYLLIILNHEVIKGAYELGQITENDYKDYILELINKASEMKPIRLFTVSNWNNKEE